MSENQNDVELDVVEKPCLKRKRTDDDDDDDDHVVTRPNVDVGSELEVEMTEPVNLQVDKIVDVQVEEPINLQVEEPVGLEIEEPVGLEIEQPVYSPVKVQVDEPMDEQIIEEQVIEEKVIQEEEVIEEKVIQEEEVIEEKVIQEEEEVIEEEFNQTFEQISQEIEQVVEGIEERDNQIESPQIEEPIKQHQQIIEEQTDQQTEPQIEEPKDQQIQQPDVEEIQQKIEQQIHQKVDQQIVQVEQQIHQTLEQVDEKIKQQMEYQIQQKIDQQVQEKVDKQIVQVEQQIKQKFDQQIVQVEQQMKQKFDQQIEQQIDQKLNQQKQSKDNSLVKTSPVIPEWFITNTQKAKEDQLLRLKELKDELMTELSHQFNNTVDRVVKTDKQQFEKHILRAMQHCFLDVENELQSKNLMSLKNGNSIDEIEEEEEFMEEDEEEEEEEGEIKSCGPEEKTDEQKDKDLIKKLKIILDNLSPNDCNKVYGKMVNMKIHTKSAAQVVVDLFFSKAKEMPKLSYVLVDRLVRITDYDPAFLHLRELLLKKFENDLANGTIVDEVMLFSFVAKKGYLLPDSFVSRCIYFIVENECNVNVEFLCEFVNIAGENYRNFPFMIDCIQKLENIAASGKYGKDITNEINQLIYRRDMLWC